MNCNELWVSGYLTDSSDLRWKEEGWWEGGRERGRQQGSFVASFSSSISEVPNAAGLGGTMENRQVWLSGTSWTQGTSCR